MVPKCRSSRSTHCIWRPWTIQSTPKSHRESTLRFHSRVWAWPRGILRQIESILSICLRIPRRESLACRKCKRQLVVYYCWMLTENSFGIATRGTEAVRSRCRWGGGPRRNVVHHKWWNRAPCSRPHMQCRRGWRYKVWMHVTKASGRRKLKFYNAINTDHQLAALIMKIVPKLFKFCT